MKRFMKFMLAFVLTVMCLVPSVGAIKNFDNSNTAGKITISNAVEGKTYDVYQMFKLDSCTDDGNETNSVCTGTNDGYVYKIEEKINGETNPWYTFVNDPAKGGLYLTIDGGGYVTWKKGVSQDAETVVAFSKLALEYAKANSTNPLMVASKSTAQAEKVDSACDPEEETCAYVAKFENLPLGYYLVDSSLGALCGLTTTKPTEDVEEKNSDPSIIKKVEEDSTGQYGDSNTASIGDTVNFETTITIGKGAEKYVLKDVLSTGLTLNHDDGDIVVKYNGTDVATKDYTLYADNNTFTITFDEEYVRTLELNKTIVVTYSAVLNENAVVGETGNNNTATLEYGDNHSVTSTTTTKTYGFDIVKVEPDNTVLVGAKFRLYNESTGNNEVCLVYVEEDDYYRVNVGGTSCDEIDGTETGHITIKGLDVDTYHIEETLNPDGYTKLLTRQAIEISADNYATVTNNKWISGGARVVNTKGSLLPETGGMGTALFITLGSFMIVLFGILLVAKVRMSKDNNN